MSPIFQMERQPGKQKIHSDVPQQGAGEVATANIGEKMELDSFVFLGRMAFALGPFVEDLLIASLNGDAPQALVRDCDRIRRRAAQRQPAVFERSARRADAAPLACDSVTTLMGITR